MSARDPYKTDRSEGKAVEIAGHPGTAYDIDGVGEKDVRYDYDTGHDEGTHLTFNTRMEFD